MTRPPHDDTGAVALIAAITTATVLFAVGALALDLGNAFARRVTLQSSADLAAAAGARALPSTAQALTAAVASLCGTDAPEPSTSTAQNQNTVIGWPPGTCPADGSVGSWATDGDLGNGEIVFYGDDTNHNGYYDNGTARTLAGGALRQGSSADERVTSGTATAIRVVTPPARVQFGLASAIGFHSVDVTRAATARIGTASGWGTAPFFLLDTDLDKPTVCIRDSATPFVAPIIPPTATPPVESSSDPYRLTDLSVAPPSTPLALAAGDLITLTLASSVPTSSPFRRSVTVQVYVDGTALPSTGPGAFTFNSSRNQITFPAPAARSVGTPVQVWLVVTVSSRFRRTVRTSTNALPITYAGAAAGSGSTTACQTTTANRGYVDEPRITGGSSNNLAANLQLGLDHSIVPWSSRPLAAPNPDAVPTLDCAQQLGTPQMFTAETPHAPVTCIQLSAGSISAGAGAGFFAEPDGRLRQTANCPGNANSASVGSYTGVDANSLFQDAFHNPNSSTTMSEVMAYVTAPHDPALFPDELRGALSSAVFACPRFALVPVVSLPIDATGSPTIPGGVGSYPVVGVRYVWFDQFVFAGNGIDLTALTAWVIDPRLLPQTDDQTVRTVAGSPGLNAWVGSGPQQVALTRDSGDPLPAAP